MQDSDWHRARRDTANPNRILIHIPAIINIAVGLGLMGMFAAMSPGSWLWSLGLLPLFLALGWRLIGPSNASSRRSSRDV